MCGSPPPQLQENTAQLIVAQNDTQAAPTAGGIVMTSKGGKGVWQSVKDGAAKLLGNLCSGLMAIICSGGAGKATEEATKNASSLPSKAERFKVFLDRLGNSQRASNFDEAYGQLTNTLN